MPFFYLDVHTNWKQAKQGIPDIPFSTHIFGDPNISTPDEEVISPAHSGSTLILSCPFHIGMPSKPPREGTQVSF